MTGIHRNFTDPMCNHLSPGPRNAASTKADLTGWKPSGSDTLNKRSGSRRFSGMAGSIRGCVKLNGWWAAVDSNHLPPR